MFKSVIQISQYNKGRFNKSKSFTIHKPSFEVKQLVQPLTEQYKDFGGDISLRIQVSQYENKKYDKEKGFCFTLYNVELDEVYNKLVKNKTKKTSGNDIISRIAEFTSTKGTELSGEYKDIHKKYWCLCRLMNGSNIVLHISEDNQFLIHLRSLYKFSTYIIAPEIREEADG